MAMSGLAHTTWFRLLLSGAVGVVAGLGAGRAEPPPVAVVAGWIAGAAVFCAWTWLIVGRMDAASTRVYATREDPGRAVADLVLVAAALAGVGGVGVLIAASAHKQGGAEVEALIGVLAVAASWFVVHTMFTLRYARLYFAGPSDAIDFNSDDDPVYADFAYLGFTIGMTYQVSDTALKARAIRLTALRHALLSFLLGAVVLAATINLVSQLASSQGG